MGGRPDGGERSLIMRYPEGQAPDPLYPHSESMHHMLTLSMVMAILIGVVLFVLGRRGNILWMKVWSLILIVLSVAYLVGDSINLI